MGILTEEVEVKVNSYTVNYYKSLGYEIPMKLASESYFKNTGKKYVYDFNKSIVVKINDLHKKSNVYIDILCDMCKEKVISARYVDYNKVVDKSGSYTCKDCSYIKGMQTHIVHYGEHYFKTDEFKEKRKKTCMDKFGVENPLQNKEIMEVFRSTLLQKYGYENPSQVPEFKEKMKLTTLERFGVTYASKNEEIKEKIRNTNIQRYGVPYTQQSSEVRAKANETLCNNGTQKTSRQQIYLHSLFGGQINYPISYYAADICFPEEKICIEYSGGGHDLRVTLGRLTQKEFDQKETIRNIILKREGYKKIEIVSKIDKLPSDQILFQMLQQSRDYFATTNHTWQTYDIDKSMLFNAEHKQGVHYDFGSLRKIN